VTAFALDPARCNLIATGAVLAKAAYSEKVDPTLGYKPKLTDGNGDVVQAVDDMGLPLWTFDVSPDDEDRTLPIIVTVAARHMPVVKRWRPVELRNPVLNVYARSSGKRAELGLNITCDAVISQGESSAPPSSSPSSSSKPAA
jgi:hypothetical protein